MKIIINSSSMVPIYEQIVDQVKAQIISGELKEDDNLPSVRTLSKELRISALTVKKAYDSLEQEGFTVTIHGKGTYVAAANKEMMMEEYRREVEEELTEVIRKAKRYGLPEEDIREIAGEMGITVEKLHNVISSLHEFNPMMGHRGCRLAVTYPEIAAMQTRAVIKAALNVQARHPEWNMVPEIMIPLVGEVKELKYVKSVVVKTADEIIASAGSDMKYLVGTMIEIPRAALTADEIAKEADFFSFGTNDLTQMTFGFSRDDAGKFLDAYYDRKIYENDPFAKLDQAGVGRLVEMACKLGRSTNPELHLGICGEHGGDPSSVEFCHRTGLDYVSCSPFRVPIARLAAAQAAIKESK